MLRSSQDFFLGMGRQTLAGAGPFALAGVASKDVYLERLIVACNVDGLVTRLRVARQNLIQSNQGFPLSMLFFDQMDDQGAAIGLPLKGGLQVDMDGTLDAAGIVGAAIGTAPLMPDAPVDVEDISLFNFIFGLGGQTLAGAGPFILQATALRDVVLADGPYLASSATGEVTSFRVAGAEMLSGDQAVDVRILDRRNTDLDGLMVGKLVKAGEIVTVEGTLDAAGTIRGGLFLLE